MTSRHRGDRHRPRRNEAGFTLPELLVAMVIMPLLVGAVATGLITLFMQTNSHDPHGAQTRLYDSNDAQATSAFFVRDVESAATVYTGTTDAKWFLCGNGTQVLGLQWTIPGTTTHAEVSYNVPNWGTWPPAPGSASLIRYFCTSSGTSTQTIIARDVFQPQTGQGQPTDNCPNTNASLSFSATCDNGPGNGYVSVSVYCGSTSTLCGGTGPYSAVKVASVQLDVQENLSGYHYTLSGTPNQAASPPVGNCPGGGSPPCPLAPPLLLDTAQTPGNVLNTGNCTFDVNGPAAVDAPNNGSVTLKPNGEITGTASTLYTADATSPPDPVSSNGGTYPQPVVNGGPIPDPYSVLTPPTSPSWSAPYPVITETTPNWSPPATLASAIYVVTNGMKLSGNSLSSGANGVLIYVTGGSVNLTGVGTITLSALGNGTAASPYWEQPLTSPPPPTLPEPVIWVAASDSNATVTLGGNGNETTINGAIYAPTASVVLNGGGNGGAITADAIDGGSLSCNGGGNNPVNVTVGTGATGTYDQPTSTTIALGDTVSDKVTVTGPADVPMSGAVDVYICGPGASSCDDTGTLVATNPFSPTTGNYSFTTSYFPGQQGAWCFAAYYEPSGPSLQSSSDTTADGCFTVSTAPDKPTITYPVSSACYTSTGTGTCATGGGPLWGGAITGTASDMSGTIAKVQVLIETTNGYFWDGTTQQWVLTQQWNKATDDSGNGSWSSWSYPVSAPPSSPDYEGLATVEAKATDTSGNTGQTTTVNFYWNG